MSLPPPPSCVTTGPLGPPGRLGRRRVTPRTRVSEWEDFDVEGQRRWCPETPSGAYLGWVSSSPVQKRFCLRPQGCKLLPFTSLDSFVSRDEGRPSICFSLVLSLRRPNAGFYRRVESVLSRTRGRPSAPDSQVHDRPSAGNGSRVGVEPRVSCCRTGRN